MTGSPKWKVLPSSIWGRSGLILVLIALAAAIPRLLLGASQFIEYDGYWHIFIAQQDNWANFWNDVYVNAHPPLYFLLLKAILHLGRSLLIYRSISLVTGIASVFLVGRIALKITESNTRAYQTALAYGLALPAIIISCEVRSYMLSVFFVLLSYSYLLDIPKPGNQTKARIGFAAGAIVACLSHYFAFFYSAAAMALLLGRFVVRRKWKAEILAEAATSLPIAGAILTEYLVHAGALAEIQGHLLPYYYDPHGRETIAAFLSRNWQNFLNLFSPFEISNAAIALGVLIVAAICAAAVLWRQRENIPVFGTLLVTAIMLAEFVVAAVAGKYPFGGDLRQQYLLFPFLLLCGAIFVERAALMLRGVIPGPGRLLLNTLAIVAIVWISAVRYEQYPKTSTGILADRMQIFDQLEPTPAAVFLDQFNLITFFTFHHNWDWTFVKQPISGIDEYRLRRGQQQMLVFRDKTDWNLEPNDSSIYSRLAECLRTAKIGDVSIFSVRQAPPKAPFSDVKQVKRTIVTLANVSAICAERMTVDPVGWYATFGRTNCPTVEAQENPVTGTFDDTGDNIQYTGLWNHGSSEAASGGTVSSSKDPGAVARLTFEGTQVDFVYSTAFNRGIAEIKLDGKAGSDLDLYSPSVVWQAHTLFRDLKPGKHTLEVTVSGRKNAAATDQYVDVDAFIVR